MHRTYFTSTINIWHNVWFQKMSILPPQKGLEIPGVGRGILTAKNCKEMYGAQLEIPEGWWVLRKNPFCGGGMDNLWNHTMVSMKFIKLILGVGDLLELVNHDGVFDVVVVSANLLHSNVLKNSEMNREKCHVLASSNALHYCTFLILCKPHLKSVFFTSSWVLKSSL